MKFIISTSALLKQLQLIEGVIGSNTVLPILEDFLFDIKDNKLTLFATDLETSIKTELKVESNEEGKFAIPAKILTDTLKILPDQPLTFSINKEKKSIEITSDNGKYKLAGEDGDDFPRLPETEDVSKITIPSSTLARAINSTIFALGTDELRPAMTGCFFEIGNEGVTLVSTDAHRLVRHKITNVKADKETSFIIPKKALTLLKNVLPEDDTPIEIQFNKSNAFFSFNDIRLICRLIDAKYPDYNAVIPSDNNNTLTINKNDFLNSLKRVSIYSNKTTYLIKLKITGSELQILAEDVDFSNQAQERLTCNYGGEDIEIGFNGKFITEMLPAIDSDELIVKLSGPTRAGVLLPSVQKDNEEMLMIVMPVMLNTAAAVETEAKTEKAEKQD